MNHTFLLTIQKLAIFLRNILLYTKACHFFLHFESLSVEGQNWGTIENIFAHEHIQLVYTKASVVSRKNVRCFATNFLAS